MNGGTEHSNFSSVMLVTILHMIALIDFSGLVDYAAKAVVASVIWLIFKIIGDTITEKINQKKAERLKGKEHDDKS
jgi:hypothetical protein